MGTLYCDTGGSATNSGSTDQNTANLTGSAATVAGSVVTLDGSPDLSSLVTSGPTQSSIYIADATNSNRKIFWITAVDNGAKTVTVDVAPTGVVSSAWAIGGRFVLTNASQEAALRPGDTLILNNSPAAAAGTIWTFRNAGDATSGFAKIMGKSGVRPVLNTTNTSPVISCNSLAYVWIENLELDQDGASGTGIAMSGIGDVVFNVKISDAGGAGITASAAGCRIINTEITGVGADGITNSGASVLVAGCSIHGCGGDGFEHTSTAPTSFLFGNLIYGNTARGVYYSGATGTGTANLNVLIGNTIYGNGNSGLEVADADTAVTLIGNIWQDNGDAAGEANVEWAAGFAEALGFHGWNTLYDNTGADAPINFTVNAQVSGTEFTTDPQFTNAAGANFAIPSTSPAYATGMPLTWLGASTTSFISQGAMQLEATGGGGLATPCTKSPMFG